MQWTPVVDHAHSHSHSQQWAEQHFDISSTTRSPAHTATHPPAHHHHAPLGGGGLQRGGASSSSSYQYAAVAPWANDDISALTASNLLKRYAEKYSVGSILDMATPLPLVSAPSSYSDGSPPSGGVVMNGGRKAGIEPEAGPWPPQDGSVYPMSCIIPEGVSMRKGGVAEVGVALCSSPGLASSSLSEPSYSTSSCGSHIITPSQEYGGGAYSAPYLHGGGGGSYGGSQSAATLPSPLHSSGLQPVPAVAVPSPYNGVSPGSNLSGYSYPPAGGTGYPTQGGGYSPGGGGVAPPSAYLPPGIAAPTPLPAPSGGGYPSSGYHQNHAPHHLTHPGVAAPTPLSGSSSLKRKAFYMTGQPQGDIMDSASSSSSSSSAMYFGYGSGGAQARSGAAASESPSSMYRVADGGGGSSFDTRIVQKAEQQQNRKYSSQQDTPPSYVSSSLGPTSEQGGADDHAHLHLSHSSATPASSSSSSSSSSSLAVVEDRLKSGEVDPHLLGLVTSEILQHQQLPPLDWSDIAGLEAAKAALMEEAAAWPVASRRRCGGGPRVPDAAFPAPDRRAAEDSRCLLLFGPPGGGRTSLARCLAGQMGAPFLRVSGRALANADANDWSASSASAGFDGREVLRACFLVARSAGRRRPAVLFVSEADALLCSEEKNGGGGGQSSSSSSVARRRLRAEMIAQLDALLPAAEGDVSGGDGWGGTGGRLTAGGDRGDAPHHHHHHHHPGGCGGGGVVVVCSTSRPQDMDDGVLRRYFARRVLVPLPDAGARRQMLRRLLLPGGGPGPGGAVSEDELASVARRTEGFSGPDLARLCREAAAQSQRAPPPGGPMHGHHGHAQGAGSGDPRGGPPTALSYQDLDAAFCQFQTSVPSQKETDAYAEWSERFGSCGSQ